MASVIAETVSNADPPLNPSDHVTGTANIPDRVRDVRSFVNPQPSQHWAIRHLKIFTHGHFQFWLLAFVAFYLAIILPEKRFHISTLERVVKVISLVVIVIACILLVIASKWEKRDEPEWEIFFLGVLGFLFGVTDTGFDIKHLIKDQYDTDDILELLYLLVLTIFVGLVAVSSLCHEKHNFIHEINLYFQLAIYVHIVIVEAKETLDLYRPGHKIEKSPLEFFVESGHFALSTELAAILCIHRWKSHSTEANSAYVPVFRSNLVPLTLTIVLAMLFFGPFRYFWIFEQDQVSISSRYTLISECVFIGIFICLLYLVAEVDLNDWENRLSRTLDFNLLRWSSWFTILFTVLVIAASAFVVDAEYGERLAISAVNVIQNSCLVLLQNAVLYQFMAGAGLLTNASGHDEGHTRTRLSEGSESNADQQRNKTITENIDKIKWFVCLLLLYNLATWLNCIWLWKTVRMLDSVAGKTRKNPGSVWALLEAFLFPVVIFYRFHVTAISFEILITYKTIKKLGWGRWFRDMFFTLSCTRRVADPETVTLIPPPNDQSRMQVTDSVNSIEDTQDHPALDSIVQEKHADPR